MVWNPLQNPSRRVTVGTRVVAGLAVILGIGSVSMLIIYQGLGALRGGLHELALSKQPLSAAAYEMEINVNGITMGTLKYLESAEPQYRRLVEDDRMDFERAYADYLSLSESPEEKALADSIDAVYREISKLAELLMAVEDRQEARFSEFAQNVERIDDIIDERIHPQVDHRLPSQLDKVMILGELESDIAEVSFWVANYRRSPRAKYREQIFEEFREFEDELNAFKALNLTSVEQSGAAEIESRLNRMLASTRQILNDDDLLEEETKRLAGLRIEIDRILDEKVQVLAGRALHEPRRAAEAEAEQVLHTVRLLIPIFIVFAVVVAFLLIKSITGPLRKLKEGTEAVQAGDLSYRIDAADRDEFSDLARHFDEMVAKLQTTTVSKELLENSEEKLRQSVAELRREIHERIEAESQQARLQASLRRSERMSAMGALVAGVAHEVRNPLFGVSSTLDAMEARFGQRAEYQRYLQVLRGEIERLNDLMRELLEYGTPSEQVLAPHSISEVIAEALAACEPLARSTSVGITSRVPEDLAPVRMQPSRMVQVFRNLVDNALQHSSTGAIVRVEAREIADNGRHWVECVVRDSGPGFEDEDMAQIFEPFFSRRSGGTGLGLSIVHRIVEEHGGQVSAAGGPGDGAVLTVRLPAVAS